MRCACPPTRESRGSGNARGSRAQAHRIKNEETDLSQTVRGIACQGRLLLTGTPLQNNMHELWALLNFLYPYIFPDGSSDAFDSAFNLAASKVDDDMLTKAHYMLRPFVLRRIKADVEKTLPPKEEIKLYNPSNKMAKVKYKISNHFASSVYFGFLA